MTKIDTLWMILIAALVSVTAYSIGLVAYHGTRLSIGCSSAAVTYIEGTPSISETLVRLLRSMLSDLLSRFCPRRNSALWCDHERCGTEC